MNNNNHKKSWVDMKLVIASMSFFATLWLWNIFARDLIKASALQAVTPAASTNTLMLPTAIIPTLQPTPFAKIYLSGNAPVVSQQVNEPDASAPAPVTQTSSSK